MKNDNNYKLINIYSSEFDLYKESERSDSLIEMLYSSAKHIKFSNDFKPHFALIEEEDYKKYVKNISKFVYAQLCNEMEKNNYLYAIPIGTLNFGQGHLLYNHCLPKYNFVDNNILVDRYLDKDKCFNFDFSYSSRYLEDLFSVLKTIFDPRIMNYNSDFSIRKSYIIFNLLQLGIFKAGDVHFSSIFAPFTLASLTQSIENYYYFKRNTERDAIYELREQLFFRKVKRNLIRHYKYSANNETRRLKYYKDKSQLISLPYSKITSIEDVKPIRILEKITYHIQEKAKKEHLKKICIKVGVIGNFDSEDELSYKLCDLVRSICIWFNKNYGDRFLYLEMNYLKHSDKEDKAKETIIEFDDQLIDLKNNHVRLCLREDDFQKLDFQNNAFTLDNYILNNDVLFLWDCPWLSEEQFDIEDKESLETFSKRVSSTSYIKDFEDNQLYRSMEKSGLFNKIDNQLNRITSSNTTKAGTVTRIPRDYILDFLKECIEFEKEQRKEKTVYIYFSMKNGINYSKYSRYIFLRNELYGGKKISILKFTTNSDTKLSLCGKMHFEFDLWSVIKYTEISYALEKMQYEIDECKINFEEKVDYIQILKDTHIILEPDMCADNYYVVVRYNLFAEDTVKQKLSNEWLEKVRIFIDCLFNKAVFSDEDIFGNQCIKMAFQVILYSHSNCLDNLYFYEKYKKCCEEKNLNYIFITKYDPILKMDEGISALYDTFSDKSLYSDIIEKSFWSDNFTFAMYSKLDYARMDAGGNYSFGEIADKLLTLSCIYGDITENQDNNIKNMLKD